VAATAPKDVPYTPAGQSVQEPAPARLYCPAPHRTDVLFVEPAGQEYPALQASVHVLTEEPPAPKRPASHGPVQVEVERPALLPNRPGSQLEQDTAPEPLYCPAGHWVTVGDVDPAGHVYPAVQSPVHDAVVRPVVEPYLPAGQLVQVALPPVLYCPATQIDCVEIEEPVGQKYPGLQSPVQLLEVAPGFPYLPAVHCPLHAAVVRPVVEPKVPPGQGGHDPAAAPVLNVPTAHAVQDEAPAPLN